MATPKKQKTTWEMVVEYKQKGLPGISGGLSAVSSMFAKAAGVVNGFSKRLFEAGVTTIFVDRLMQSFVRAWRTLNEVIGADRLGEAANGFSRISEFTGVAVGKLQAFTYGVKIAGAELDDVSDLFQTIAERVDDLRAGEGGITGDFARYGFTKDSFAGVTDALDMWLIMADKFDKMRPDERLAAMEKLLGGDIARKFGQTVKGGAQSIIDMMQAAQATGAVLGPQEIADARAYYEVQRRITRSLELVSNALGAMLMPHLKRAWALGADALERTAKFLRLYGGIKAWLNATLTPILDKVQNGLEVWDRYYKSIEETIFRLGRALLVVAGGAAFKSLFGIVAMGRAVLAILKSAVLWIDDIITYLYDANPRNSVFGELLRTSPMVQQLVFSILYAVDQVMAGFKNLRDIFTLIVNGPIGPMLVEALSVLIIGLSAAWRGATWLLEIFTAILSVILEMGRVIPALMAINPNGGRIQRIVEIADSLQAAATGGVTASNARAIGVMGGAPSSSMPPVTNNYTYFGTGMSMNPNGARMMGRKARGSIRP